MNNDDKINKVLDKISSIDVTLAEQHLSLKEHMRRTEILENKVEPIEKQMLMVHGGIKIISVILICISALAAVAQIIIVLK